MLVPLGSLPSRPHSRALCLSPCLSIPNQDKHKAPAHPLHTPCPYGKSKFSTPVEDKHEAPSHPLHTPCPYDKSLLLYRNFIADLIVQCARQG